MKKLIIVLSLIVAITSGCGSSANTKNAIDVNINSSNATESTSKLSPGKQFVSDKLDPLMQSVNSTVDSTWKYNVGEPLDNHKAGTATKESVLNDLQLATDMFELKAKEVEKFEIPVNIKYNESEPRNKLVINNLKTLKEDLAKAVRSRSEVAQKYIKIVKDGTLTTMTQEEMDNLLIMPNAHLQNAMTDYKYALDNIE